MVIIVLNCKDIHLLQVFTSFWKYVIFIDKQSTN